MRRSFCAGVARIRDPTTVMRTRRWIKRLQRACNRRHGGADDFIAKSFLSSYLMVAKRVGSSSGERKAFNAASPMLNAFAIITVIVSTKGSFQHVPRYLSARFQRLLREYHAGLRSWKSSIKDGVVDDHDFMSRTYRLVHDKYHQVFWTSLKDDLKRSPPCYARTLLVLSEVRDGLKDTLFQIFESIDDILDICNIKLQLAAGTYNAGTLVTLAASLVDAVTHTQPPEFATAVQRSWAAVDTACAGTTLKFMLELVAALRVKCRSHRCAEAERIRFDERRSIGIVGVERTKSFIVEAIVHSVNVQKSVTIETLMEPGEHNRRVHATAMFLHATDADVTANTAPETFGFDGHQLAFARRDYLYAVNGCAIFAGANNAIPASEPRRGAVLEALANLIIDEFEDYDALEPGFKRIIDEIGVSLSAVSMEDIFHARWLLKATM